MTIYYHSVNGRFSLAHLWLSYPEFAGAVSHGVGTAHPGDGTAAVNSGESANLLTVNGSGPNRPASFEFAAPVPATAEPRGSGYWSASNGEDGHCGDAQGSHLREAETHKPPCGGRGNKSRGGGRW